MKLYLHSLSFRFLYIPHFRTLPETQDFLWQAFNKIPLSWYYLNCLTGTVFVPGSNLNTKMSTSCNKCFRDVASLCFKWRIKMMEAICKNMKNAAGHAVHIMGPLASVIFGTSDNLITTWATNWLWPGLESVVDNWPRNFNFFQGVFFSPWGDSAAHHRAGIFLLHWLSLLHFTINHIYNNIWNNLQCNQLYVTSYDVCYCHVWFCFQLISRFFFWVSGLDFSINKICIKLENVK